MARLAAIAEAGLWLLLAFQAARLAWILVEPAGPVGAIATPGATAPARPLASLDDPFYRAGSGTGGAVPASLDGYLLHGVRIGMPHNSAILAHDGRQRAYRTGDTLAPGVVLAAVAGDHVVLRTAQGTSRLALAAAGSAAGARASTGTLPVAQAPAPARAAGAEPAQLIAQAGLLAHEDGGYTLIPRGDDTALRQAGLQAGDVLLAVDGQPLTPERLAELQGSLSDRDGATLTVRRDGTVRTVAIGGDSE